MKILILLLAVAAAKAQVLPPQTGSTCAVVLCVAGKICREVLDPDTGIVSGRCLDGDQVPAADAAATCAVSAPLLESGSQGEVRQAFCGRGLGRVACPAGWTCNIDPADRFAICCQESTDPAPQPDTCKPNDCKAGYTATCKYPECDVRPGGGGTCPLLATCIAGTCPVVEPGSVGICITECEQDWECGDGLLCCRNACGGGVCTKPVVDFPPVTSPPCPLTGCNPAYCPDGFQKDDNGCQICKCLTAEKPGQCPRLDDGLVTICLVECEDDSSCLGGRKCCNMGCNRRCEQPTLNATAPQTCQTWGKTCRFPKECLMLNIPCQPGGQCDPAPACVDILRERCGDKGCEPGQKCQVVTPICLPGFECPGPTYTCTDPKEKKGYCPAVSGGGDGAACQAPGCGVDGHCSGDAKCCKSQCGSSVCTKPETEQRPSCNTVRCGSGEECVLENVLCVRAPCYPQPVCRDVQRAGTCPAPRRTWIWFFFCGREVCNADSDCRNPDHKCCEATVNCGRECVMPDLPSCRTTRCPAGTTCEMLAPPCAPGTRNCRPLPECVPVPATTTTTARPTVAPRSRCDGFPCAEGQYCVVQTSSWFSRGGPRCVPIAYACRPGCGTGFECKLNEISKNPECSFDKSSCRLPAETGFCKAYLRRWRYDPKARTCSQFTYGGCGGNANNFETFEECMKACETCDLRTCFVLCEYGRVLDANGCQTCACNPRPRDVCGPVCEIFCPNGKVRDDQGCDTCTCRDPPGKQCGPVCAIFCEHGNVRDERGCDTCTCRNAPGVPGRG